jgi:hypothetical protein
MNNLRDNFKSLSLILAQLMSFSLILFAFSHQASFAQTITFATVTECINYNGADKDDITKIIITEQITGTDYSAGSEWSKFRTLNTTYIALEDIEIQTNQAIPDGDNIALFYYNVAGSSDWLKSFSAPNVTTIGTNAFRNCYTLASVSFPNVATIGDRAFDVCSNLIEINFSNVTEIGIFAFANCDALETANFPKVQTIGNGVFGECNSLKDVNFPNVTEIGINAFVYCPALEKVSLGTGFTTPTEIEFGVGYW